MSGFSVSYNGLADAELHLHEVYLAVNDVSARLYTTANKAASVKSLENKGYVKTIRVHGLHAYDISDRIKMQGESLQSIGGTYSRTEKRILGHLSELASVEAGFSKSSSVIARNAQKAHEPFEVHYGLGRALEDSIGYREARAKYIQGARYWRSTEGSRIVKGAVEKLLGEKGMENPVIKGAIETVNKATEEWEDIFHGAFNATNPESLKSGAMAVAGMMGLGGFANMVPRYQNMTDAISNRSAEIAKSGHPVKAVGYAVAGSALATGQFVADGVYNLGKAIFNGFTKAVFKDASTGSSGTEKASWNIVERYTKKSYKLAGGGLEKGFTAIGDWCWSRLDGAFGL